MPNNKKNYITKTIRLNKDFDKDLIEKLNFYSKRKKMSFKIKEILMQYFEEKDNVFKLLQEIKDILETKNFNTSSKDVILTNNSENNIVHETKGFNELMMNLYDKCIEEDILL